MSYIKKNADGSSFLVHDDGTVEEISNTGPNPNPNPIIRKLKRWLLWILIILVIWVIVYYVVVEWNVFNIDNNASSNMPVEDNNSIMINENLGDEIAALDNYRETYERCATYISVSNADLRYSYRGDDKEIIVRTDGEDWDIKVEPESWISLSRSGNKLTVKVEPNDEYESRTDYFILRADDETIKVNVYQGGNTNPWAKIESLWIDHDVYFGGYKGMMIHSDLRVRNLDDRTIYVYAFFYQSDNSTPLHNIYGTNLYFYDQGKVAGNDSQFDDFKIFIPYMGLNMAPNLGSVPLSFNLHVRYSGKDLDIQKNNTFIFAN